MIFPGIIDKLRSPLLWILTFSLCLIPVHPVKADSHPGNRIEIYAYGPGIVQIIDLYGRRSGRDLAAGNILEEIPFSKVEKEGTKDRIPGWTVHIRDPAEGVYRIKLLAEGPGAFAIDVDTVDSVGNLNNHHLFRRVKTGDTLELLLTYSSDGDAESTLLEE